jgi:hypothetical protein
MTFKELKRLARGKSISQRWTCKVITTSTPSPSVPLRSVLTLLSYLCLGVAKGLFISRYDNEPCINFSSLSMRDTCPSHLAILDLFTQILYVEEYRSLSYSLCSFLHFLSISNNRKSCSTVYFI